ncbi:MAG: aminopeptidase PepB [Candidatus Malihini olakiniferum]
MKSEAMQISLSTQPAEIRWGEKALLSVQEQGLTIHLPRGVALREIQRAGRKIDRQGIKHVKLLGEGWDLETSWAFWQGYRAPKGKSIVEWAMLEDTQRKELDLRLKVIDWVRDTINLPAEDLGPEQLAKLAVSLLYDVGGNAVSHHIIKGEDLQNQNYVGLHTVGRGSRRQPLLLVLEFKPNGISDAPVFACMIGKGITFDSGGYSLKPSRFMNSMKSDMGGAALVTGALALAIAQGLTRRVKLYLCCADNMISGNAFCLGDILHYRNGKTVEVMNADAEGRLVLADGLIDASAQTPQWIIDCATLTGAAKTALGNDYHAIFSFDDTFAERLLTSAKEENEPFWRLPLEEFHRSQLPSGFAELSNVMSETYSAGASTAAAFLSHFVSFYQKGWLHIDCSATYHNGADEHWATGATGLGVRTLANLLLSKARVK